MRERGWTDLTTNLTGLTGLRLPEQLPGLAAGWGALDRQLLPSLLHESTHHWCFLSPLGFSLSHLQFQAWANILTLDGQDDDQSDEANFRRFRVDDCISRIQLVLEVLRPISEGLALFAEFDASSPPHSRVQAPPFELLMTLYSPRPKTTDEVDRMHGQFYQFLAQQRVGDQMLKRKANVLGSTLCDSDGYLLGYMFVRGAWTVAAAKNPAVRHDTDLWLRYVKSFFFDDFHGSSELAGAEPGSGWRPP